VFFSSFSFVAALCYSLLFFQMLFFCLCWLPLVLLVIVCSLVFVCLVSFQFVDSPIPRFFLLYLCSLMWVFPVLFDRGSVPICSVLFERCASWVGIGVEVFFLFFGGGGVFFGVFFFPFSQSPLGSFCLSVLFDVWSSWPFRGTDSNGNHPDSQYLARRR